METLLGRPLEVEVRDSVDKALKILKQKMSKEGILQEIKRRRYYEKPSVKRKRKMREARKRRRREAKRRVVRLGSSAARVYALDRAGHRGSFGCGRSAG